jgi:hypothetical protein
MTATAGVALEAKLCKPAKEIPHRELVASGISSRRHNLKPEYPMAQLPESERKLKKPGPVPAALEIVRQGGISKNYKHNLIIDGAELHPVHSSSEPVRSEIVQHHLPWLLPRCALVEMCSAHRKSTPHTLSIHALPFSL